MQPEMQPAREAAKTGPGMHVTPEVRQLLDVTAATMQDVIRRISHARDCLLLAAPGDCSVWFATLSGLLLGLEAHADQVHKGLISEL